MAWEQDEELLWEAVAEAVKPIAHLDGDSKLETKIRNYFKKAVKTLEIGMKPWHALINDYADSAFGAMFAGLGDKPWLYQGEADFLLVLDAAVKDLFPSGIMKGVPQQDFERAVLAAHDRAFEEQRYLGIMWDVLQSHVQGKATQKKAYNALDLGQKEAFLQGSTGLEDYTWCWIDRTIAKLSNDTQGDPESCIPLMQAAQLFHALIEGNALPIPLVQSSDPLQPDFVNQALETAYTMYSVSAGGEMPTSKGKGKGKFRASPY